MTNATSGRISETSSRSIVLGRLLESRLAARMDVNGSPEYALTWKHWVIDSQLQICALRGSPRRTSDKGFTGWPTPQERDAKGEYKKHSRSGSDLPNKAALAGWVTPSSRDWKDTIGMSTTGVNPDGSKRKRLDQLPRQAALILVGWPTPTTVPNTKESHGQVCGSFREKIKDLISGPNLTSFHAATAKTGGLAPDFPRWLMGFPTAWTAAAPLQGSRG